MGKENEQRKVYSCRVCQQPMTSAGHTQFPGQWYCPNAPDKSPTRSGWLCGSKKLEPKLLARTHNSFFLVFVA